MSSPVDKIKERLDIADVIGSYIKLEKAGSSLKAKCPFHNEKTPSFFVSPERGTFYCFGCGAKGDMFTFVQEFEGLDFMGAFKLLARKAGVEITAEGGQERKEKETLFSVLESASFFFQKKLKENQKALDYLYKRGLKEKTIETWQLGFAPDEWTATSDFLKSKGFSEPEMYKAGLLKKKERSQGKDSFYDSFRGRIMFPIFDSAGRVVGFSGRIFGDKSQDEKVPKYINSPETPLFLKSEILYGLNFAKSQIRKKDYAILVEGQMDLIMSHQEGFANSVASSGTALTSKQLSRIKRLSDRLIIAFDSDGAGMEAAKKSSELALSLGMEVKVASLPSGSDPADLMLKDIDQWKEALKKSSHVIDFTLENIFSSEPDKRKTAKRIEQEVLPLIAKLQSSMQRAHFVHQISHKIDYKEESIWEDLKRISEKMPEEDLSQDEDGQNAVSKGNVSPNFGKDKHIEKRIMGIVYWQESQENPEIDLKEIKDRFVSILGDELFKEVQNLSSLEKDSLIFEAEAYHGESSNLKKDIEELFLNLERDTLKKDFAKEMARLGEAERLKNLSEVEEIKNKVQELMRKISSLTENT